MGWLLSPVLSDFYRLLIATQVCHKNTQTGIPARLIRAPHLRTGGVSLKGLCVCVGGVIVQAWIRSRGSALLGLAVH